MDSNKNIKKIAYLGIILLIIAGLIVVALKGFNVEFLFGKHETIEVKVGKEVYIEDVKEICNEVFSGKKYLVKKLEVFNDSFQINVESITDEEKNNLVEKINQKYELEETVETLKVYSIANRRIRDSIKPYVFSIVISFIIVFCYMLIRFRKINAAKIILNFMIKVLLTEAILLSVIAIIRLPVSDLIINLLVVIAVAELIYCLSKSENKLHEYNG